MLLPLSQSDQVQRKQVFSSQSGFPGQLRGSELCADAARHQPRRDTAPPPPTAARSSDAGTVSAVYSLSTWFIYPIYLLLCCHLLLATPSSWSKQEAGKRDSSTRETEGSKGAGFLRPLSRSVPCPGKAPSWPRDQGRGPRTGQLTARPGPPGTPADGPGEVGWLARGNRAEWGDGKGQNCKAGTPQVRISL